MYIYHLWHNSSRWAPWFNWFKLYFIMLPWRPFLTLSKPYTSPLGPCALLMTESMDALSEEVRFKWAAITKSSHLLKRGQQKINNFWGFELLVTYWASTDPSMTPPTPGWLSTWEIATMATVTLATPFGSTVTRGVWLSAIERRVLSSNWNISQPP